MKHIQFLRVFFAVFVTLYCCFLYANNNDQRSILEKNWVLKQGEYTIENETVFGNSVFTCSKNIPVVLITGQTIPHPIEFHTFVRLHTEPGGSAYASFQVGKKDASDTGFSLSLSITDNALYPERVQCSVRYQGKYLHDNNELAKDLNWVPAFSNDFT
ncbi:MAG: hypothetical protein ACP5QD_01375, partial [Candidatus Ratteibacteria bacterium]